MFTFTLGNVKQLSVEKLRGSPFSEFQIEGALTVNAFADNASVIFDLSDQRNVRIG